MAITPTIFGRPSSTLGGLCYYSRFFTAAATTILLSSFLVHYSTTVTGMLSSILHHLHHNYCRLSLFATLPWLHCLPFSTTPLRLCCLVYSTTISTKKLQKSCLGAVNPVTVFPKVLVYFVFYFYTDTIKDVVFLWS